MMESVGGPGMSDYRTAKENGLIEPDIQPLADAIFHAGGFPLSSCEGHAGRSGWPALNWLERLLCLHVCRPFVLFSGTEEYARAFMQCCDQARGLHYVWTITGHFQPNGYELTWKIESLDHRLASGWTSRAYLKRDIALLARAAIKAGAELKL